MVNRQKRNLAGDLISRFLACEISSDEFNDAFPRDKSDPALNAIYSNLWLFYTETRTHKLDGKYKLRPEAEPLFERSLAFLRSDLEYEWPPYNWIDPKYAFLRLFGLQHRIQGKFEEFERHGDFNVWPFIRESDCATHGVRQPSTPPQSRPG